MVDGACQAIIPGLIEGLGTLGAGIVGAIGGSKSTSSANAMNYKINQMNNEFNAAEAQKARDYQTEMWERNNAYNDPSAARQRLASAGYNPYLALNSGAAGTATNVGSPSTASAASAAPQQPYDWSTLASSVASAAQIFNQTQQTDAQVSALQGQKSLSEAQTYSTLSNVDWYKLGPEYRHWLQTTGASRAALSLNTDKQQLENMQWSRNIMEAQRNQLLLSNEQQKIMNKYIDQGQQLQIQIYAAQYYDLMASGHLKYQQAKTELSQRVYLAALASGQRISNKIAESTADALIQAQNAQNASSASYFEGFGSGAYNAGINDTWIKYNQARQGIWQYSKRYWDEALNAASTVGNFVGTIRPRR
nr:MAG TPA: DNA pilot protein VP2 [Microviridae sp.]